LTIRTLTICVLSGSVAWSADAALTIYNQNFAVIRETIPLDLKQGANNIRFGGITALLEPESVMLRDPAGKRALQILEQNYRADPISADLLLSLYEGKTIDFLVQNRDKAEVVSGKVIRSNYGFRPAQRWTQMSAPPPAVYGQPALSQPIIEVDGKLRFQLPGSPLFPALADDTILKPAIHWLVQSDRAGKLDAELCYVSGGMNWQADYNVVSQQVADSLEMAGWVTMDNQSGKTFENARIKLMAGDVNKIRPRSDLAVVARLGGVGGVLNGPGTPPPVTEKTFDEYHLYTLERPATLHDRETKQVEFVRASGIRSKLLYVYDGAKFDDNRTRGWNAEMIRNDTAYGTQSNPKVWVMREFMNSESNHLGMPLPHGRLRFYRRDNDGRLEFTGEDTIQHTPRDETIRVFTGAAFDLVGERRRVNFRIDHQRAMLDESFEIKVRNHKKEAAEVRVVEHMYRWSTWEIQISSSPYAKTDSQTVEFKIQLQPDEEKSITYAAHYTWSGTSRSL
jgi:hypothetical protein